MFAISTRLLRQFGINEQTLVAMLGMDDWRIHAPVKQGDTLHVTAEVRDARLTSEGDRGVVTFDCAIVNQHGKAVQTMTVQCMYLCSPAAQG